ncbi:RluA family pseudouridine synthase [Gaoshiqia sediminis]|uniref:RluA family pseudouridine synthase n=1 Tax=Gaoshiqia sediminis TaxID=2986998 RepID=A0AA41YAL5_9BACT|nr:RluA family pseudouridine synthase [Gaoshiqia sediminis]MCW0482365.1 RluA family pseudouridine synthase [Gaoshiqia sediminis]
MQVIYEDNHIIAVNKACGEIVQGDKTGDVTLIDQVKAYIKKKYNKPGDVYLGSPHRLDRPTSGIVLFARTSKALTRLNEMFQDKDAIKKTYWAVVDVLPELEEGTLEHYLWKDEGKNKSFASSKPKKGGRFCSLSYKHMASVNRYHLLEIDLHTGRHHQIRVQLAKMGCHIKGDLKYGAERSNPDGGIHLHARKLEFIHPVKKEPIKIVARPPKGDAIWDDLIQIKELKD